MRGIRVLIAAIFGLFLFGSAAQAAVDAFTTGNLNMRRGPGTGYARIVTLPVNAGVTVYGCSGSWCEVRWGRYRGWVSARYLDHQPRRYYRPRVYDPYVVGPVIGFHIGPVWRHHPHIHHRHVHRPHFHRRHWHHWPRRVHRHHHH